MLGSVDARQCVDSSSQLQFFKKCCYEPRRTHRSGWPTAVVPFGSSAVATVYGPGQQPPNPLDRHSDRPLRRQRRASKPRDPDTSGARGRWIKSVPLTGHLFLRAAGRIRAGESRDAGVETRRLWRSRRPMRAIDLREIVAVMLDQTRSEDKMAHAFRGRPKGSRKTARSKQRLCLRCDRAFLSEGPHNRLCQTCREFLAGAPTPVEEYPLGVL
jgi:hypothetical protein